MKIKLKKENKLKRSQEYRKYLGKTWEEKDGTSHSVGDWKEYLNLDYITYRVVIKMPIINKSFESVVRLTAYEMTDATMKRYSKIAKSNLLSCMAKELSEND
jgi:hypothetical protein